VIAIDPFMAAAFFPAALLAGFLLDLLLGDPAWLPHPVQGIGALINGCESLLRKLMPGRERAAGIVLVVVVLAATVALTGASLLLAWLISPWLAFAVAALMSWQALSARCLAAEAHKVRRLLADGELCYARRQLAGIVGRDTMTLPNEKVAAATIETVAENSADGVVAPAFYLALGGPVAGLAYKAINTMDSMVGYKNERYLNLGRAAALLDDAANFLPSRICALLMVAGSSLVGLDSRAAWRCWRRDGRNHTSPNSAQSEAAAAGALRLQLGGDSYYGGVLVPKPTIGDPGRPASASDIRRAVRLLYATSVLCLLLSCGISWAIWSGILAIYSNLGGGLT